jgi:hypothetical protein
MLRSLDDLKEIYMNIKEQPVITVSKWSALANSLEYQKSLNFLRHNYFPVLMNPYVKCVVRFLKLSRLHK